VSLRLDLGEPMFIVGFHRFFFFLINMGKVEKSGFHEKFKVVVGSNLAKL